MIRLINDDCLNVFKTIESNSIDLVVIDPPYNIKKADWDSWESVNSYVEFMGKIFTECERVLKNNGSFYFFHNDFLQIVELQNWLNKNSKFIFKQLITWSKMAEHFRNSGFVHQRLSVDMMRNYYGGFTEYCLFYTFQDVAFSSSPFAMILKNARLKKGLSVADVAEAGHFYGVVNHGGSVTNWESGYNVPNKEQWDILVDFLDIKTDMRFSYNELKQQIPDFKLREYFRQLFKATGKTKTELINEIGQSVDHCLRFDSSQWLMPTKETYNKLLELINDESYLNEFEKLSKEYHKLSEEYKKSRYKFNTQQVSHDFLANSNIWRYEPAPQRGHITPKPLELIENIIKHSSNENDIVLDCFMGSGTTGVACKNLKRKFIGIEKDKDYFELAKSRIDGEYIKSVKKQKKGFQEIDMFE